jgi:hypothetical protein
MVFICPIFLLYLTIKLNTIKMTAKQYMVLHKEEVEDIIRDYFKNFLIENDLNSIDDTFDTDAYEKSAMEGELVDEINDVLFGDEEGIMAGDDEAYEYIEELADEVIYEPGMEAVRNYFDNTSTLF